MAIVALQVRVPARQVELGICVLLNRKRSRREGVLRMAGIALILVRRGGEFRAMPVGVTGWAG